MFGAKKEKTAEEIQRQADRQIQMSLAFNNGKTSASDMTKREYLAAKLANSKDPYDYGSLEEWADDIIALADALLIRLQK